MVNVVDDAGDDRANRGPFHAENLSRGDALAEHEDPVAGPRAIALLGEAVRETGTAFVDQLVDDLASPANRQQLEQLLHDLIGAAKGEGEQLDQLIRDTLMDVLEQVKAQIAVQQWKLEEQDGPEKS